MRIAACFLTACAAVALLATGTRADNKIPDRLKEALEKATTFEVYSLDPTPTKEPGRDDFHGYKALGKTTIRDAEVRKRLIAALEKGVVDNKGDVIAGFLPRHGIRVVYDDKTFDLVLSFETFSGEVWNGEKKLGDFLVTNSPQPTFDKVLKDAKIPLADSSKKEEPLPGFANILYNADLLEVVVREKKLLKIVKTDYDKDKKEISWLIEAQADLTYDDFFAIRKVWQNDLGADAKGPAAHFFDKDKLFLFSRDLKEAGKLRNARKGDRIRLTLEVGDGFHNAALMEIRQP